MLYDNGEDNDFENQNTFWKANTLMIWTIFLFRFVILGYAKHALSENSSWSVGIA